MMGEGNGSHLISMDMVQYTILIAEKVGRISRAWIELIHMDMNTIAFFEKMPDALPLYETIRRMIRAEFENVTVRVQKTQISFSNRYNFAFVSLPVRRVKGYTSVYVILTFGTGSRVEHPRIFQSTEPYPGRWTHHVVIQKAEEVDAQVKAWIAEAYHFSDHKR